MDLVGDVSLKPIVAIRVAGGLLLFFFVSLRGRAN
jgi:hypothetical protein